MAGSAEALNARTATAKYVISEVHSRIVTAQAAVHGGSIEVALSCTVLTSLSAGRDRSRQPRAGHTIEHSLSNITERTGRYVALFP